MLGIVSGSAQVRFGGEDGDLVGVTAGDVVVIPAGVAHACIEASDDFAVVGAYPNGADYDTIRDDPGALAASQQRIAQVPCPTPIRWTAPTVRSSSSGPESAKTVQPSKAGVAKRCLTLHDSWPGT